MRRILRIFPIYFGFLAAQVAMLKVVMVDPIVADDFFNNLKYFATFTNNWFVHLNDAHPVVFYHARSLATEEQFYVFWPVLFLLFRSRKAQILAALGLCLFDQLATGFVGLSP